jgi:beta-lactamase class A
MTFTTLTTQLDASLSKLLGSVSLKVKFLSSDAEYFYKQDEQFWAASVIKIPIACVVYMQQFSGVLDSSLRHKIKPENRVEGSGIAKIFDSDTAFTLHDLLVLAITISDNSATNELIDIIGWESVENYMKELGLENSTFRHKMMITAGRGPNLTTAQDMAILLEKLYTHEIPGSKELIEIMKHTRLRDRISARIPNNIPIAHKPGSLPKAMHEVGIVYSKNPFIFCFFSDDQEDKEITRRVLGECAQCCYEFVS